MGFIPARCAICTSAFHSGNISCLPCGHTFHHACVLQWIQQSKTCPQCRCLVLEKNIIKQIYFDLIDFDNHDKTSADDYAQKCEQLSIDLEKEKGSKYELNQKLIEMQNNYDNVKDLLKREKQKVERKLPSLESRNRELEMRCRDYDFVQEELRKMKSRLAASEFYQLLAKGSISDAEGAVDRFVNKNGDPNSSQFINLLKRQLHESRNANTKLQQNIRDYEKDHDIKNRKLAQYKKLCQELKTEAEELRSSNNVNTPYNSRLKRVFDLPPRERRPSLGFDESIVIPDDVIESAFKSKPVMGKIRNSNEVQENSFNSDYQGVMDKALPFPNLDDTLDTSADFTLPKNVLNRISAGASLRQTNPLGIVPKGAQRSLEILKNREGSGIAPRPIKKPVKRKFEPTNPDFSREVMIDCHCHLVDNKFKDDVNQVVEQAINEGVNKFVVVPEFRNQFEKVLKLRELFPNNVIAAIGIHPVQKKKRCCVLDDLNDMERFIMDNRENIRCIGEFKSGVIHKDAQQESFTEQLRLARIFNLPVNVHSRSAPEETINILSQTKLDGVLLHAFGGSDEDILNGAQRGFFFSVPPSYSSTEYGAMLIRKVPLDLLLLESDSPALGPRKGERNTPSNCIISANFIAQIKERTLKDVIEITNRNAGRFLNRVD